jgi:hypothetical protein
MSDLINLYNRPTDAQWYRVQANFNRPIAVHQLAERLAKMGSRYAYAPGKKATFGAFAAKDAAGKLRYLDSTDPINTWDLPAGAKFYPGAAIAHVLPTQPAADYMVIYMYIEDDQAAGPLAPDGGKPVWTRISRSKKTIVDEWSSTGKHFANPFTPQQKTIPASWTSPAGYELAQSGLYLPAYDQGQAGQLQGLGAWFIPWLLGKLGLLAIDALIVYLMYQAGVFSFVVDVFFAALGVLVDVFWPIGLAAAGGLLAYSLIRK